jgi:hypothetical protein
MSTVDVLITVDNRDGDQRLGMLGNVVVLVAPSDTRGSFISGYYRTRC